MRTPSIQASTVRAKRLSQGARSFCRPNRSASRPRAYASPRAARQALRTFLVHSAPTSPPLSTHGRPGLARTLAVSYPAGEGLPWEAIRVPRAQSVPTVASRPCVSRAGLRARTWLACTSPMSRSRALTGPRWPSIARSRISRRWCPRRVRPFRARPPAFPSRCACAWCARGVRACRPNLVRFLVCAAPCQDMGIIFEDFLIVVICANVICFVLSTMQGGQRCPEALPPDSLTRRRKLARTRARARAPPAERRVLPSREKRRRQRAGSMLGSGLAAGGLLPRRPPVRLARCDLRRRGDR